MTNSIETGTKLYIGDWLVGIVLDYERTVDSLWVGTNGRSYPIQLADNKGELDGMRNHAVTRFAQFNPDDIGEYCFRRVTLRSGFMDFCSGPNYAVALRSCCDEKEGFALIKPRLAVLFALH
jgi:hypothetical protein